MAQERSHVVGRLSPPLTRGLGGFWSSTFLVGSYIGGHLTSRLEDVVVEASFLSGSSISLKHVICLFQILTQQPVTVLLTGGQIPGQGQSPPSETDREEFSECVAIFIYATQKFSHNLQQGQNEL